MPKYLVTLYYTASMNREIEAASPDEALEKAGREGVPREDMAEVYDCLVFDEAVVQEEVLPDGRHVPVHYP